MTPNVDVRRARIVMKFKPNAEHDVHNFIEASAEHHDAHNIMNDTIGRYADFDIMESETGSNINHKKKKNNDNNDNEKKI